MMMIFLAYIKYDVTEVDCDSLGMYKVYFHKGKNCHSGDDDSLSVVLSSYNWFQDICQGVGQIVVAVAENHTKLLLDLTMSTEESSRMNAHGLIQMVLVSYCMYLTHW